MADRFDRPEWTRVRTLLLAVWAHNDGKHVGIYIDGKSFFCGSERAMRGKLAAYLYKHHARGPV